MTSEPQPPARTPDGLQAQVPQVPQVGPPTQPAWAKPERQLYWKQTEPLEYHQLYRGAVRYAWWRPFLALVLAVLYYISFSVAFMLPIGLLYGALNNGAASLGDFEALAIPDTQNPWSIFASLGSVALMIPAVWLAMLSTGLRPVGRGWSVALRIRWRWIWRTVLPAVVSIIVMNVLGIGLEIALSGDDLLASSAEVEMPTIDPTLALWSMLIVLLIVPLQATAEELVFRGMFMQTLGAWLGGVKARNAVASFVRGPWIPILVPALLFGFSHIYDIWGFLAVMMMAVAAGWLAWRTGGLEAAITLHVINNLVAFSFMSMGAGGETGQVESTGGGPGSLFGQLLGFVLYCWWVDRSFARRDGRRTRIDYVQTRMPVAAQAAPPTLPAPPTTPAPTLPAAGPITTDPTSESQLTEPPAAGLSSADQRTTPPTTQHQGDLA